MAWAIITIYTSKCVQMDSQQLLKTSKFYSRSKKCDIEKTLGGGYHHPPSLVARRLNQLKTKVLVITRRWHKSNIKPEGPVVPGAEQVSTLRVLGVVL